MDETLFIVMPTYNEETNIRNVVEEWYPILENADENSRLVIADGGSKDDTLNILYDLQKELPKLIVISKPNTDHGTKIIFLYKYAIENGANWIFQTDSDGQTVAEEFTEFWNIRKCYDAVMGNRVKRGDGLVRKGVEYILRVYLKIFFGTWVPDANAPFRLMKCSVVKKYINLMPEDFNLPNAILAACFKKYNDRVIYKKISFQSRQGGKNYMNLKRIFKIGMESVNNFAQIRKKLKIYASHKH